MKPGKAASGLSGCSGITVSCKAPSSLGGGGLGFGTNDSGNCGMFARNWPPSARNRDFFPFSGRLDWMITAFRPNGRLKLAANGKPAATFSMFWMRTGPGLKRTSC